VSVKPLRLSTPPWAFGLVACSVAVGTLLGSVGIAVASDPPAEQAAAVAPSPAAETVGRLHEKLLEAMMGADELGYLGRFELLTPALKDTFDLDFMASKSVGRSWKTLSEEQKRQWQDAFGRLITANFAGRFEGYSGQSFETLGEQAAAHGTIMVLTRIVDPEDDDVQLNYRMQEKDERWRIVDVYFNGTVSELAMRRSEYSSMFKREGFEELLEAVDQRIADFASGEID
jgi:phospholipid transport system substrate-binding protein